MTAPDPAVSRCRHCGAAAGASARYCPSCGRTFIANGATADELVVAHRGRLRISADRVSLRALQQFVEECVVWWQQRLQGGEVSREEASRAIEELRMSLHSLSQQIAGGRQTMRVTSSLPAARRFPLGCPRCGRGNRWGATHCYVCGWTLVATAAPPAEPPSRPHISVGLTSDTGRVRPTNQDTAVSEELELPDGRRTLCCMVADGMGGAQAGAEASRLACAAVLDALRRRIVAPPSGDGGWRRLLRDVIVEANHVIYNQARADAALRGMGTTIVVVLLVGRQAHLASVGDSRVYLANQRGIADDGVTWALLTVDHSLVARLVDLGFISAEEARAHPQRHVLYRALGVEPSIEVDTDSQPLQAGDRLLLCSDGLSGVIPDEELAALLTQAASPQTATGRLVALANERGGHDNLTALAISLDQG